MRIRIFIIAVLLSSCGGNLKKEDFRSSLNDYLETHPFGLSYRQDSLGNKVLVNCNYPSYHAYFFKDSLEKISVILHQKLYYTPDIVPQFYNSYWNTFEFKIKGFFMYQGYKPIIVHDSQNFSKEYLFEQLEVNIPDSLIYNGEECNNDFMHIRDNQPELYNLK